MAIVYEPLVSVIIPNYNHARFVGDAIRSVLNQDYRNFEIIVVDDGSTDDSRDVIAQFNDKVQYIYQKNAGLSAARNTGIRIAKGSVVGVLDADDMYEPLFLATVVKELESDPGADGIYCGYQFVDQENNLLPQIESRSVPDIKLYDVLLDGNFFVPESILVRNYCYELIGLFDETLSACEDWDMWLRLTKNYRIIHTTRILTRHRILAGSMSTDPFRMLTNRLAVLKKHVGEEPEDYNDPDGVKRRAYGRAYLISCMEYLQYGDSDRSYECFQKMSNVHPELLMEIDTYYRLGCGDQPKGSMGDLKSLNVKQSSKRLLDMMDKMFVGVADNHPLKFYQRRSYVNAYIALGILNYGVGRFKESRYYLLLAITMDPGKIFNRQLVFLYLKSLLGAKKFEWAKAIYKTKSLFRILMTMLIIQCVFYL